jgi:thioesterase domain-containing protein/aryl carrier-like protein
MTREDRVLQFASPGFDAFLEEVFLALLHGAALVPRTSEMMADFAIFTAGLVHEKISVADLPTAFWRGWTAWLARTPGCFPECLRCVIIGGEAATEAALASWRSIAPDGCQLWNTYGPTEATIVATAHPLHRWPAGRSGDPPIGQPLEGMAVRVAGRDGSPRPPGLVGEIWISGCGVSPGYWQRPDLDAVFVTRGTKRWYRSGDLAAWNGDGDLVFLGRMDDQIKLRGHRIEPDEVRRQVERIEGVRTAHVALAGQPPMLTAWIVPTSADAELPLRVRQSLAARLPSAMVPAAIIPVAELPLTSRGKVDRRRLPEPAPLETTASEDPMTAWACRVFAEILERPVSEIDPEREFQRQGGDSISALELALRLRDAGLSIEPGDLAHDSSPSAVARRFSQPSKSHPTRWEPIVVLRPGKAGYPPLVLIHATPGDVLGYGNLAAELPDHLPCWGIVSRALHEPERPHRSIPAMAADYLKELQARLGDAPFVLGGWCYGGLVAYEMACTLHRMNRPPPLRLLLIETWCPQPASRVRALRLRLQQARAFLGLAADHRRGYLRQKLENRRVTPAETPASETRRDATFRYNLAAALGFRADPYPLPVDLFLTQATANDTLPLPEGGWSALAKNRTIHPCAGGHADLLHPPNVGTLAAQIASLFPSPI